MRGLRHQREDRVEIQEIEDQSARARVRGREESFDTTVDWSRTEDSGIVLCRCTCSTFQSSGSCSHLWAFLLQLEDRGAPGPTTAENLELADLDAAPEEEEETPSSPWRDHLSELRRELSRSLKRHESRIPAEALEIYYFVNLEECFSRGGLVIELFQRERRRSGEMGLVKPLPIREERLASLPDPLDRRLVELLVDLPETAPLSSPDQRVWSSGERNTRRALVPPALYESLIPEVAATGRLGWWKGSEKRPSLDRWLRWDGDEAWNLIVTSEALEGGDLRFTGKLVRNGKRRDLSEPLLLLSSGLILFPETIGLMESGSGAEFPWISLLRRNDELVVPVEERSEALEELWQLPLLPALEGESLSLARERVSVEPRLVLRSRPDRRGWLEGEVDFEYDGLRLRVNDPRDEIPDPKGRRLIVRDREAEAEHVRFLRNLEASRGPRPEEILISERDLPTVAQTLLAEGWRIEAQGSRVKPAGDFKLNVSSGIDWLDLEGTIRFGDQSVGLHELLEATRDQNPLIQLGDGSTGLLPEEWLERFGSLSRLAEEGEGDHIRFLPSQALLLDAWLAGRPGVDLDRHFVELRKKLREAGEPREAEPPAGFEGTLRAYQRRGLGWLLYLQELGLGGCLADDMGLGKTIQVLALLQRRKREDSPEGSPTTLVVAPRSLVYNWLDEAERFTPELVTLDYTGTRREEIRDDFDSSDLVVTTYGVLRRDIAELRRYPFDYAILDEAQAIKNPDSQTAKASRLLQADHRLALTGTPVENHLGELWSIFEFLNPGMLGELPETLSTDPEYGESDEVMLLSRALSPFILRRTKEQVLEDLPPKTEQTLLCSLGPEQRKFYEDLRQHYRSRLTARIDSVGLARSKLQVLEALLRLRQAACHPGLIDPERKHDESTKLDTLLEQITEVLDEGHKALVFSQFTSFLALLRKRLDALSVPYEYLDGSTRDRGTRVERFQTDPELPLFLISLKAGGLGLNLTAADYVFLLDPWWNPAVEAQAIDRAHRIGQDQPVFAYRLIAKDTVEEKILSLQEDKRELAEAILGGDDGRLLRQLTPEDLEVLLG